MRRCAAFACITLGLAGAGGAQPSVAPGTILDGGSRGDGQWHWIEVEPARGDISGWMTISGLAAVTIRGSHFHADLHLPPGEAGADLSLDGTIAAGMIRATEILLNTDAGPVLIRGRLRRLPLGQIIEERIAFHGGQSGDASFLGLFRRVAR